MSAPRKNAGLLPEKAGFPGKSRRLSKFFDGESASPGPNRRLRIVKRARTRVLAYTVPEGWAGPVKRFAREYLGFSARALSAQKYEGGIWVNGLMRHADFCLAPGDRLRFPIAPEEMGYPPVELPLSIVYEDGDFLIVDKAQGMPVHPSPGHDADSLLNAVAFYYRRTGQAHRVRPLYRLDKDTGGLLAIAKHRAAAGAALRKRYLAVCEGVLTGGGTVDAPIGLGPGSKIVRVCGPGLPGGQPAVTHWQALKTDGSHTLLGLTLETGRTHQIRAHMAYLGHPLAGDDLYGGSLAVVQRQALFCAELHVICRAVGLDREFRGQLPSHVRDAFPRLL